MIVEGRNLVLSTLVFLESKVRCPKESTHGTELEVTCKDGTAHGDTQALVDDA
jgi:hypothetical protein